MRWQLADPQDSRRILFVTAPTEARDNLVTVGIEPLYMKHLTPAEAREMAAALLEAATLSEEAA